MKLTRRILTALAMAILMTALSICALADDGLQAFSSLGSTEISIVKVWNDQANQDISASLTLCRLVDGQPEPAADAPAPVFDAGLGTYTWSDLPAQETDGTEITYCVTEAALSGYMTAYPQVNGADQGYALNGETIVNRAGQEGAGWSYDGITHVLTITQNVHDYRLASSSSQWFIGTPFEQTGIDHTVKEIVIQEGVTSIGDLAFYGMGSLTKVTFPSTLERIGSGTFRNCSNLPEVVIPASVKTIGCAAFAGCGKLAKITFEGNAPLLSAYDAYYDFNNTTRYAFTSTADVCYKPYPSWTDAQIALFSNKCYLTWHPISDDSGTCGENAEWYVLDGNTLIIRGTGSMTDYSISSRAPWSAYRNSLKSIIVCPGITRIGDYAFSGGSFDDPLVSLSLPSTLTSIGFSALDHCQSITELSLPDTVTDMEGDAFFGCYKLVSIHLPAQLKTIGNSAFGSCYALESLVIPDSVTEIGAYAFANCESLASIELSSGLTCIPAGVLANTALEEVEVPEGVTAISASVFSSSSALRSVRLPISVQSIDDNAFSHCPETLELICHEDSYAAQFAAGQGIAAVIEPHTEAVLPAVNVTCTTEGITEGVQCAVCGKILVEQEVIPAAGHLYDLAAFGWVQDGSSCTAVFTCQNCGDGQMLEATVTSRQVTAPDCVNRGETEYTATVEFGTKEIQNPENPDETLIVPRVYEDILTLPDIPALGHTEVTDEAVEATCTESGLTEGKHCSVCSEILAAQTEVEPLGHTEVIDSGIPATYVTAGLTEGSHCSVCGTVLVPQRVLPAVEEPPMMKLPEALEVIEAEAFAGNACICVVIPEGCLRIEAKAFMDCAQLQFIEIPASVTGIDHTAFAGCSEKLIVITTAGSAAETFARENGIICVLR